MILTEKRKRRCSARKSEVRCERDDGFISGWIFNSSRGTSPPTRSANRHARIRAPSRGAIFPFRGCVSENAKRFRRSVLGFSLGTRATALRFEKDRHSRRLCLLVSLSFSRSRNLVGDPCVFSDKCCSNCARFANKNLVAAPVALSAQLFLIPDSIARAKLRLDRARPINCSKESIARVSNDGGSPADTFVPFISRFFGLVQRSTNIEASQSDRNAFRVPEFRFGDISFACHVTPRRSRGIEVSPRPGGRTESRYPGRKLYHVDNSTIEAADRSCDGS